MWSHLPGYSTYYMDGGALSECDHNPTNAKPLKGKPKHDIHHVQALAFPWMHVRLSRGQGEPMPILERTRLASFGASLR